VRMKISVIANSRSATFVRQLRFCSVLLLAIRDGPGAEDRESITRRIARSRAGVVVTTIWKRPRTGEANGQAALCSFRCPRERRAHLTGRLSVFLRW
jgi:hypothetical protein